jgi:hypothetical protein
MTDILLFGGLLLVNLGTLVMIRHVFNGGKNE